MIRLQLSIQSSATPMILLLSLVLLLSCVSADYYKILGIKRRANLQEINKAHRNMARKYHPDKNKDEDAAEMFATIRRAHEILSDDQKREIYDRDGEEGVKQFEKNGGQQGGGGFNPFGGGDGGNPFEQFFGGGQQQQQRRGNVTPDMERNLNVKLVTLYLGETIEYEHTRQVPCAKWRDCVKNDQGCQGPGIKLRRQQIAPGFVQQVQVRDPSCLARGKSWSQRCRACPNGQTDRETVTLDIVVEKGMQDNERIVFHGMADEKPGLEAGDLVFNIRQKDHDTFRRMGDDLMMEMELNMTEALTGFIKTYIQLDGEEIGVTNDEVSKCDRIATVQGNGMPRRNGRGFGDMFITFTVDFPETLTERQKEGIKKVLQ